MVRDSSRKVSGKNTRKCFIYFSTLKYKTCTRSHDRSHERRRRHDGTTPRDGRPSNATHRSTTTTSTNDRRRRASARRRKTTSGKRRQNDGNRWRARANERARRSSVERRAMTNGARARARNDRATRVNSTMAITSTRARTGNRESARRRGRFYGARRRRRETRASERMIVKDAPRRRARRRLGSWNTSYVG